MRTTLVFSVLTLMFSLNVSAQERTHKHHEPKLKEMQERDISFQNEFSDFQGGPFFLPPHAMMYFMLGYLSGQDLFKDFLASLQTNSNSEVDKEYCDEVDSENEDVEGSVKVNFDCSEEDVQYSCYASVVDGEYELTVPSAVSGLSCKISVESIVSNDDGTDIEVDGVETEEEIELSEETTVSIDLVES